MRTLSLISLALFLLAPVEQARAQDEEAAKEEVASEEGPKVQQIRAVERGFFVATEGGVGFIVNKVNDRSYGIAAPIMGLYLGYDILEILNFSIGANLMALSAQSDPAEPPPVGDLFFLMPQVRIQFAVITTERNFFWIQAHGGFGFGLPGKINVDGVEMDHGGNGPIFGGTLGFERFTKLRHFSIGVQAGAEIALQPGLTIAVTLTPTVKYTF